ncbi:MAG TPA: cobalamin biosynthesis protein CbiA [Planctomycetota bacterium]|nr:cobalamin biosynthesis protein CbiA [Planctomycetota bacterium]
MIEATLPLRRNDRLVMVVGSYGSGKTEVSVNLALRAAAAGRTVQIADLDLVNPYFRCREARRLMEAHGVRVVVPPGALAWADLPIVVPQVLGMLSPPAGTLSLFDVGGDDVGARVLGSLRAGVLAAGYELWQVINPQRPFTRDADGCLAMREAIEGSSRLSVTGLAVNAHLMDETTPDTVLRGLDVARDVARRTGLPIRFVAVMDRLADDPRIRTVGVPVLVMQRRMLPPWRLPAGEKRLPAGRPVPLGRRNGVHGTHRD